jgi:hypothetical protein
MTNRTTRTKDDHSYVDRAQHTKLVSLFKQSVLALIGIGTKINIS